MLKLHKDFEIRTSTFQVFSQTKRVGVTFPFAPSNFWDIGLFITFSCGKKIVPDFCLCFLDFWCVVFLIYLMLVKYSAHNQGFQADVYKNCVYIYHFGHCHWHCYISSIIIWSRGPNDFPMIPKWKSSLMFQRKQAISVIGKLGNTLLNNPSTSSLFLFVISLINIYVEMKKMQFKQRTLTLCCVVTKIWTV